ncbi:UNKNOWN [Stylonychia lemnae]|uniref:FZ domain-containing protein n=1 Tax=Stylonychia lemnae TaxID=5949 RepID=A0A078AAY9_STYLE|nr:UNKNOWN [Stylonychia lemnae]|eukprot:CDW79026.1 UNKNOWN [Stylonychia lemnae]
MLASFQQLIIGYQGDLFRDSFLENEINNRAIQISDFDIMFQFKQTKEEFDNRMIPKRELACTLKGIEEAMCVPRSMIKSQTPFCNEYIYDYYLWSNWTLEEKDFQVQEQVILNTENRLLLELQYPMESSQVGNLEMTTSIDCLESYKQFSCRYNFPLCDEESGETYKICQTECNNFYVNCGLDPAGCNLKNWDFMDSDTQSCKYA